MNDDFAEIRSHIPDYAGHDDATARRLSDQQVRAFLGEALITLRERVALDGAVGAFEDLVHHCQFGDQRLIKLIEDDRFADAERADRLDVENRALIDAAIRARSVTNESAAAYVAEVSALLPRRIAAAEALASP